MPVKIRLRRMGAKKRPFYRIVVANSTDARDGRFIESVGYYDPCTEPPTVKLDAERVQRWLKNGAQPSDTARSILQKQGVIAAPEGAAPPPPAAPEKAAKAPSKKAAAKAEAAPEPKKPEPAEEKPEPAPLAEAVAEPVAEAAPEPVAEPAAESEPAAAAAAEPAAEAEKEPAAAEDAAPAAE